VIIVRTGSRLHFGLFDLRRFGGVGMMIDEPGVAVTAQVAEQWSVHGLLAHRSRFVIDRLTNFLRDLPPLRLEVLHAPPEHAGFGAGTQVSFALATAIVTEVNCNLPVSDLARILDRGQRSAIGIYGFEHGGLLLNAGRLEAQQPLPRVQCIQVPSEWRVLLVTPNVDTFWSGERERDAFSRLTSTSAADTYDEMRMYANRQLVPAARAGDLAAFGAALTEFNARAGELFAPIQGGCYSTPVVAHLVQRLQALGLVGIGQSSWGPTVFAFGDDAEELERIGGAMAADGMMYRITRPRHHGAGIEHSF
jgi:beta-ribofuranosylaminobenzene 5'-phosphate synthase